MVMRRGFLFALLIIAACGEQEILLDGERLDVRGNPFPVEKVNRSAPLALPSAIVNRDWTHVGGNARHQLTHPALATNLNVLWRTSIGQGNDRKHRITADPVVLGGRVFAMDSRARVTAVTTSGTPVWSVDLTPSADNPDDVSGGGLAAIGTRVFATNGFGEVTALDAASGRELWRHDFGAGTTAPPMVQGDIVYVSTTNAAGWALSASSGRVLWQVFGVVGDRASTGSSAPVAAGPFVVFPFTSGQMVAASTETGTQAWAASVIPRRSGSAFSGLSDLTGGPVFAGNRIYAGTFAGRLAAIDATNGQAVWQSDDEGAAGPIWLAGGGLFFVSDDNRLVRVDASSGSRVWSQNLPFFTRERIRRRRAAFVHHGPVLAGGRLILVSDDGQVRQFDPRSGALVGAFSLPDGAARNPVVAGRTLYVVTEAGELVALR